MVQGSTTYRILTDQVGSVRLVVNTSSGAVAERIDYDEFGNVLSDTAPGTQPFGFAGGLRDLNTGLTRFGSRDYDPVTGRWTAKDPLKFGGGLTNLYSYLGEDPINHFDPGGRWVLVFGGMAEGQFAFWGLQGSIQFAVDGSGHFGLAATIEGRTGFDFSLGTGPAAGLYPGMDSIDALNGPTGGAGVDVGEVSGGLLFSSETELAQPNACRAYSIEPDRTTSARIGIGGGAFGLGGGFGIVFQWWLHMAMAMEMRLAMMWIITLISVGWLAGFWWLKRRAAVEAHRQQGVSLMRASMGFGWLTVSTPKGRFYRRLAVAWLLGCFLLLVAVAWFGPVLFRESWH